MTITRTDPLDQLLRSAACITDAELARPELDAATRHLPERVRATGRAGASIAAAPPLLAARGETAALRRRSPPRKRRRKVLVAAAGGVLAATAFAPTAADWVGARTGWFGEPGMTENDTSEFLDLSSPEIAEIAWQLGARYPLPPGGSYDDAIARLRNTDGEMHLMSESGVEAFMAGDAACQWERAWLAADASGDAAAALRAVAVLREVPTWEAIVAVDGGGVVELWTEVADAAARGDRSIVERDVELNCATATDAGQ
jgi:hypothetical protein